MGCVHGTGHARERRAAFIAHASRGLIYANGGSHAQPSGVALSGKTAAVCLIFL